VLVDGVLVWARRGSLLKKLLRTPFPSDSFIVAAIRDRAANEAS
jgi:hypothetical protein